MTTHLLVALVVIIFFVFAQLISYALEYHVCLNHYILKHWHLVEQYLSMHHASTFCIHVNQVVPNKVRSKFHSFSNVPLMNIHLPTSSTMTSPTNAYTNPTKQKIWLHTFLLHNNQWFYNHNNIEIIHNNT